MKLNFRTSILASAIVAAAALAINPALAETRTVTVPFDFTVGTTNLPAGAYIVEKATFGNFVKLQDKDSSKSFTWVATPSAGKSGRIILRFEEQGQTHALQSIQYGSLVTPKLTPKSKAAQGRIEEISPGQ
jgi:hypothetical protein